MICLPTVVSTFASPHEPMLKPKACKRASTSPARVTAFQDGVLPTLSEEKGYEAEQNQNNETIF